MTSTIPMMNHSFRSLARRPMIQLQGLSLRPARRPSCRSGRAQVSATCRCVLLQGAPSGNTSRSGGASSGHVDRGAAVMTEGLLTVCPMKAARFKSATSEQKSWCPLVSFQATSRFTEVSEEDSMSELYFLIRESAHVFTSPFTSCSSLKISMQVLKT
ncbi:hypothetical protein GOODEAATRI_018801 [Goodea atripinnis]|uniref:Uncharacterized protein n=1 Tax=Goodea atripinnis TaxID=208336 RepID=A0ABV0MKX1_9TELE